MAAGASLALTVLSAARAGAAHSMAATPVAAANCNIKRGLLAIGTAPLDSDEPGNATTLRFVTLRFVYASLAIQRLKANADHHVTVAAAADDA